MLSSCHRHRAFMPPPRPRRKNLRLNDTQGVRFQTSLAKSPAHARETMSTIRTPNSNDVLMGRGGKNNQHSGNEKLRAIARGVCESYRKGTKKDKSFISRDLVRQVREMTPPGRFLKRSQGNGEWEDVGDEIAREKASQVLRDAVGNQVGLPIVGALSKTSGTKRSRDLESSAVLPSFENESQHRCGSSRLGQMRHGNPEPNHRVAASWPTPTSHPGALRKTSGTKRSRDLESSAVLPSFENESQHRFGSSGLGQMRHGSPEPNHSVAASWPTPTLSHPLPPPSAQAVPYLPVTPSMSNTRKRQRAYETPDHLDAYSSIPIAGNTPPTLHYYQLAQPRPQVNFPPPSPSAMGPAAAGCVTDSRSRPIHPPSSSGPAPLGLLDYPAQAPQPNEFDLFNGELLSDQSQSDRDGGAVSPSFPAHLYGRSDRYRAL